MNMTAADREHVILGEATINLIYRQVDVTVDALIGELGAIAAHEASDDRLTALNAARCWLYDFHQPGSLSRQGSPWFAPSRDEETMMETSNLAGGDNVGSSSDEKSS